MVKLLVGTPTSCTAVPGSWPGPDSWEAAGDGPSTWVLATYGETRMKVLAPDFSLAWASPAVGLWLFGESKLYELFLLFSVSLPLKANKLKK